MKFARMLLVVMAVSATAFVPMLGQEQEPSGNRTPEGLVLKTAETIEFTTDEVTWPSLDVSPDGRTILFDVLGDLYTLPIEGGRPRGSWAACRSRASRPIRPTARRSRS